MTGGDDDDDDHGYGDDGVPLIETWTRFASIEGAEVDANETTRLVRWPNPIAISQTSRHATLPIELINSPPNVSTEAGGDDHDDVRRICMHTYVLRGWCNLQPPLSHQTSPSLTQSACHFVLCGNLPFYCLTLTLTHSLPSSLFLPSFLLHLSRLPQTRTFN